MKYWLMKSEPDVYSIDHLKAEKKCLWDGIRNYQARNFMMKDMEVGDQVLFYHSNFKPPGIAGLAVISKQAQPDPTQFDKKSKYFDAKSTKENPRWNCVEVKYQKKFKNYISLDDIREVKSLVDMMVIRKGSRLSIQPVTKKEFDTVVKLAEK
jgi:predicted RNA-binding protein with PUA-like domain